MKKVRIYKPKDRPGWYISWRENGREKKRSCGDKKMAEHYASIMYHALNIECYQTDIDLPWPDLFAEYLRTYDVRRLTTAAKYEGSLTLRHFERLIGPLSSRNITQGVIDTFILARAQAVSDHTLNKDISNFRAFLAWGRKSHFINRELEINKVKTADRDVISLTDKQVRNLLISARQRSECWYVRVLLAITTGLRSKDIDSLTIQDIDFENCSLRTHSKKTRKSMAARPLHTSIVPVLAGFVAELPAGQTRILAADTITHKKWKRIRERAGLPDLRFHDLRSVFSTALQSRGVSLSVAQALLEHSTPSLTARSYTNTNPMLSPAIERLPVGEWLE